MELEPKLSQIYLLKKISSVSLLGLQYGVLVLANINYQYLPVPF